MTDTQDPTRLLHDPGVDDSLRQTLREAASHAPPIDTAAGLARLEGAIASGAAGGGAAGGGLASGALAAGAVAVALIGGGIWYASQSREPAAPESAAETVPVAETVTVTETVTELHADEPIAVPVIEPVQVDPEADSEANSEAEADTRDTEGGADTEGAEAERAAPRAREPAPIDESALAREMARISEARRALAADPARTLALVDESRRELPRSVLAQERDALRVLALVALGRDQEAAPLARRFLDAHPTSPFAERIRRAIAEP